jgi:predicted peptidase
MRPLFSAIGLLLMVMMWSCQKEEIPPPPPASATVAETPANDPEKKPEPQQPGVDVTNESFQEATFKNLPYRLLVPRNYDSTKTYPLHIFLHGVGERGADNEKQLSVGASFFLADSVRDRYPAFVVFPQCPSSDYWFDEEIMEQLEELVDLLTGQYPIAREQISLGGFSMGGYGTFSMVARYPGLFVAAVAISGDGDESKAAYMAKPKWRIFAGGRDDIVPSMKSEQMARALDKAGAIVSFKLYPDTDHGGTWHHAFSEPDYFRWLFTQKERTLPRGVNKN